MHTAHKHTWQHIKLVGLLLCFLSACQTAPSVETLPTQARLATAIVRTLPPETAAPASATPTASATVMLVPTQTSLLAYTLEPSATPPPPTRTRFVPSPTRTLPPPITRTPLPSQFIFGQSVEGRDLVGYRRGTGEQIVLVVGGIHAGFEANTVTLVEQLLEHFDTRPTDILPQVTLIFIPSLNPDGLTYGRQLRGRFNGNAVDLNRNWGCGWSPNAVFRDFDVDPGDEPFSEPETTALGSLIQRLNPAAVLFYHAAANGVYSGNCGDNGDVSVALARVLGEATGYPSGQGGFGSYEVTGSAPAWIDSIGIPAVDVELATSTGTEFRRNLAGIMAVQQWVIAQASS